MESYLLHKCHQVPCGLKSDSEKLRRKTKQPFKYWRTQVWVPWELGSCHFRGQAKVCLWSVWSIANRMRGSKNSFIHQIITEYLLWGLYSFTVPLNALTLEYSWASILFLTPLLFNLFPSQLCRPSCNSNLCF